jgi:hypothetical protein
MNANGRNMSKSRIAYRPTHLMIPYSIVTHLMESVNTFGRRISSVPVEEERE